MANKSGGASKVGQASSYKTNRTWERNRIRRLKKLMIVYPNNQELQKAVGNVHYRRGTPKVPFWSASRRYQARLFKSFVGRVDMDMFSNNEKLSGPALFSKGPHSEHKYQTVPEKIMFQLGTRAHCKGMPWNS